MADIMDESAAAARAKYKVEPGFICTRLINYTVGSSTPRPQHYPGLGEILRGTAASGDKVYIIGHASRLGHGFFDDKGLSSSSSPRRRSRSLLRSRWGCPSLAGFSSRGND